MIRPPALWTSTSLLLGAIALSLLAGSPTTPESLTSLGGAATVGLTCPGVTVHHGNDISAYRLVNVASGTRQIVSSFDQVPGSSLSSLSGREGLAGTVSAAATVPPGSLRVDAYGGRIVGALTGGGQLAPCAASGVTDWWAAGISTTAHRSAVVELANPSATPAVITLDAYTSAGVVSPSADQGLTVAGGTTASFDLASQIVGESNAAVHIHVASGAIVARIVEGSADSSLHGIVLGGEPALDLAWGSVPSSGVATIVGYNPTDRIENLSATVYLKDYTTSAVTATAYPHSAFAVPVIPSTGVPNAGVGALVLHSSGAVVASVIDGFTTRSQVLSSGTELHAGVHVIVNAQATPLATVQVVGGGALSSQSFGADLTLRSNFGPYQEAAMNGTGWAIVTTSKPTAVFYITGAATAEVALDGR